MLEQELKRVEKNEWAAGTPLQTRMRRMRRTENLRALVRETNLTPRDMVYPLFVVHGHGVREEITSMTGPVHRAACA